MYKGLLAIVEKLMALFSQPQPKLATATPLKLDLQFFAEGGDGSGEGDAGKSGSDDGDGTKSGSDDKGAGDDDGDKGEKFSQDELDKIIDKRLKRERQKWQQELEDQKKRDQMTAEERAKAEKADAEKKAQQAQEKANEKIRQAEAKAQALELGVDPNKIKYFLKLADISEIEVDDNGEIDVKAMSTTLKAILVDMPEFKANNSARGGQEFGGTGSGQKKAENLGDALKNYYGR